MQVFSRANFGVAMERIGVTHAGSLIRPPELLAFLSAADHGQASTDGPEYQAALGRAVDYVVRRQLETGIDLIDDGEMGKATWITYLYERTSGLEPRPLNGSFSTILPASRDRQNFPGAYAELDRLEHDATVRIRDKAVSDAPAESAKPEKEGQGAAVWVCTGPMSYDRAAIDRDLANLKTALAANGKDISEAFLPVVAPASAYWLQNEHYDSDEEFVYALADVLHEEYQAIVESGAFLQVDDAVLMHEADTMASRGQSYEEYRGWARLRVEALNHALRGLPEDRIRYHVCFGSWHGPHAYDPPLRDSIDLVLAVNAKYYLMEQANPRHEHEWKIWQDVTAAGRQGARPRRGHAPHQRGRAPGARRPAAHPAGGGRRPGPGDGRDRLRVRAGRLHAPGARGDPVGEAGLAGGGRQDRLARALGREG